MYDIDYLDNTVVESCKKNFSRIYPEFKPIVLGVCSDKTSIIIQCDFPDGTFYFRVTENMVSHSYNTREDADRL